MKTRQGTRTVLSSSTTTNSERNLGRAAEFGASTHLAFWVWRSCSLTSCGKIFEVVLNEIFVLLNLLFWDFDFVL